MKSSVQINLQKKKKKRVNKQRTTLFLQENEEHAETVLTFPCLYDKLEKEYNDKNVIQSAWKEAADQLDFIENSKFFILSEF